MIHRAVHLDDDEARCRPVAQVCPFKHNCARAQAPIPVRNAKVADFSIDMVMGFFGTSCVKFYPLSKAVKAGPGIAPAKKPIGSAP